MNKHLFAGLAIAAAGMLGAAGPAFAYRPFDGTDASVAETGIFELEFGASRLSNGGVRSFAAPAAVANFGLAGDTELVIEGRVDRATGETDERYRTSLGDTAVSVKHLFRRGSLQDAEGVSIASECGILLPELHGDTGTGLTCAGIVSQRWELASVHVNAGLTRNRDRSNGRSLGVIVEGPESLALRPVAELIRDRESGEATTRSALVGAIWKFSEELVFDLGLRHARAGAGSINEARFGLTWSIPLHKQ